MTLDRVRDAYSTLADLYADMFADARLLHPDDRALLERWLVGRTGRVLDLGCGPGHLTAHLAAAGVDVAGVDPVEAFVSIARSRFPGVSYEVGSFDTVAATGLDGVLSWYSTIHTPPDEIDATLSRLRGLLNPGGVLVLGFFDHLDTRPEPFEHKVTTAYRWPSSELARRVEDAGFTVAHTETRPERPERRHGAIVAVAL